MNYDSSHFLQFVLVAILLAVMSLIDVALANGDVITGTIYGVWGDPPPATGQAPKQRFFLVDERGKSISLLVDEKLVRSAGGIRALNGKRVSITGRWSAKALGSEAITFEVQTIIVEQRKNGAAATQGQSALIGSQPWVTILCRFGDMTGITPHPTTWFDTLMGATNPGMNHYWQELSYNNINLSGSTVVGWYNLPDSKALYINGSDINWQKAADDCSAAADVNVNFPNFVGINFMFNDTIGCCAWGGTIGIVADGGGVYSATWMPPWGYEAHGILAQEMGHGFGLPHSSGPYLTPYDSFWDPMSAGIGSCTTPDPDYGCIGVHTISYHKDSLAWIPGVRKLDIPSGTQTINIERLGQPTNGTDYLMAQIPIGGSATSFYTVEARQAAGGYDANIPGEAVIIHKVDTTLSDRNAQVVDATNDSDPNDAGAMWTPGETFTDTVNGISVTVNTDTGTGFNVTITANSGPKDIVIQNVSASDTSPAPGDPVTVSYNVVNQGTDTVTATYREDVYLSSDTTLDGSDVALGSSHNHTTDLVGTGGSHAGNVAVTIPLATAGGTYYLLVQGDAGSAVAESNESNNVASVQITVNSDPKDIVIQNVSASDTSPAPGDPVTVSYNVVNQGTGTVTASYRENVYLSTNTTLDGSDVALGSSPDHTTDLAGSGGSAPGSVAVTIPPATARGTHYLLVQGDAGSAVVESNESNNVASVQITVTGFKDIVIQNVSASDTSPAPGDPVTVSYNVVNQGTDTVPATYREDVYLSMNTVLDGSDVLLGSSPVHTIDLAGSDGSAPGSVAVTIPLGTTGSTYYLLVQGDAGSAVVESNESNNVASVIINDLTGGGGGGGSSKGSCFIATAAYGSYLAPEVRVLRAFRDKYLLGNAIGESLVEFYYDVSPPIADYISEREPLRAAMRWLLTPVIYGIKYPGGAVIILVGFILLSVRVRKSRHALR